MVGIDLSESMLARANARLTRHGLEHVSLCRMDATKLAFPDGCFDGVYAPYVINVVADPIAAAREMVRVCRPGGRIAILNHFEGIDGVDSWVKRVIGHMATTLTGVNWQLGWSEFLQATGLRVESSEFVNLGGVSSVVVCRRHAGTSDDGTGRDSDSLSAWTEPVTIS